MPIASVNPKTGKTEKTFEAHSPEQVEERLAKAVTAFAAWRKTSFAERGQKMRKAAELLEQRKDALARLMTVEMGKLRKAGIAEVEKCAGACRYYADTAEQHLAAERVETDAKRSEKRFQPLGCVLAVMPWNFPFWQVFRFAAPGLMAGNVGLLKHSSNVPQCALAIEEIFRDAGFPSGCFQTLLVGGNEVKKLVDDPRVVAATLTGSDAAGRSLGAACGAQLKKVVLELGGSDPFVVMPSCDLDKAVETAVTARVQNAGQSCIAAKRFIVHEKIAAAFEEKFVARMAALKVGDPSDDATQVGPLSSQQQLRDISNQVERAVKDGAKLGCGGKRVGEEGFFYAPTVLLEAHGTTAWREEIFGPVAAVVRAANIDEAIEMANDTPFGLGSAAFTNDPAEQERFANELEAGSVFINGMVKSDSRLPFGGVKQSGYGRELSREGIREFVNIKTVWIG
ncbi:MAG TPA: NAD-dependent succinate-semialdehyde dehydrogenase [Myxococcales bacterium]|jgi:succinate-semialdehyde dehydrogenase/glutarate-semialdehyde dehydrogenase|nr:NAD-dependent succinate-semialdehyde dehydrogenase [Myxococcales bacterium]